MNIKHIGILGCGWLGLPLGKYLLEKGWKINGSTTDKINFPALEDIGIDPFFVKITADELCAERLQDFFDVDTLIVNFPPERRADIEEYHLKQIQLLVDAVNASRVQNVLFVSSTSVYPDLNKEMFETETAAPEKGSGKALKLAEKKLLDHTHFKTTVLRFGGLIGDDRMPGRFLAGKKNVENGGAPVNLIHRDDCIELIYQVILQEAWGDIFNACSDGHPTRKAYYTKAATVLGLELPEFMEDTKNNFKIINSDKIKTKLNFKFKYADPLKLL